MVSTLMQLYMRCGRTVQTWATCTSTQVSRKLRIRLGVPTYRDVLEELALTCTSPWSNALLTIRPGGRIHVPFTGSVKALHALPSFLQPRWNNDDTRRGVWLVWGIPTPSLYVSDRLYTLWDTARSHIIGNYFLFTL